MVSLLLSVTFVCGLIIAAAHLVNRKFIAPVYDVVLNLAAFVSATAASSLLHHWLPAAFSGAAVVVWIVLGLRTLRAKRTGQPATGQPLDDAPIASGTDDSGPAAGPDDHRAP